MGLAAGVPVGQGAGWLVLLGAFSLHLVLGTLYSWGNLSVYVTSYLKDQGHPEITYDDTIIIYGCQIGAQSCLMYLGGVLEQKLGPRLTVLIGGALVCGATFLASAMTSLWSMGLVYGCMFGCGIGLTYTTPLVCGYKWFPESKGFVSGVILSGFGLGAFVFNQVATALVNPDNLRADLHDRGALYYGPGPVVDAVPRLFLSLGGMYTALILLGTSLICEPQYEKISDELLVPEGEGEEEEEEAEEEGYEDGDDQDEEDGEEGGGAIALEKGEGALLEHDGRGSGSSSSTMLSNSTEGGGGGEAAAGNHAGERVEIRRRRRKAPVSARELTPRELIKTVQAWHVSLCLMLGALGGLITLAVYKEAGILHFNDDRFMAVTGSLASLGNAAGRLFWGAMQDALGPYRTLYGLTLTLSTLFFTWDLSVQQPIKSKWAFAFWTLGICFCHGGNFACYPALTALLFGKEHVGPNFGLVFLPYGLLSLLGIALLPRLSADLSPLNYILGGVALMAFISVYLLGHCYGLKDGMHDESSSAGKKRRRRKRLMRQPQGGIN